MCVQAKKKYTKVLKINFFSKFCINIFRIYSKSGNFAVREAQPWSQDFVGLLFQSHPLWGCWVEKVHGAYHTCYKHNRGLWHFRQQRGHKLMYIQTLRFVIYNYLFGRVMMSATEAPNFWDDEWVRIPPPNR